MLQVQIKPAQACLVTDIQGAQESGVHFARCPRGSQQAGAHYGCHDARALRVLLPHNL